MKRVPTQLRVFGVAAGALAALFFAHLRPVHGARPVEGISLVPTTSKVVALTYDDGPHPVFTPRLLDLLDRYHVKATFFMIGTQMEKYPEVVRAVAKRGHVIGNHTYTHPYDLRNLPESQVAQQLERCEADIERLAGVRPHLFRPPRGWETEEVLELVHKQGYQTVLWSVCADHHDAPTPQDMANRVLQRLRPGAIILLHDGTIDSRVKDVEATPLIIEGVRKQGYRFVTVPELLALGEAKARPRAAPAPGRAAAIPTASARSRPAHR